MKFYQEITLIQNADISPHFLFSKVFQQIHLGLVEIQNAQRQVPVGISFPEYKRDEKFCVLGGKIRLFSVNEADLVRLDVERWLAHLSDYVHYTRIRPVPKSIESYAVYRREQPKTGKERLARRYAKRHQMDFETALNETVELSVKPETGQFSEKKLMRYSEMPHRKIAAPFIRLKSLSSGNMFCLWIKKSNVKHNTEGLFSTYGLSATTTVPEF